MKRAFIRALWGIYEHEGRRFYMRRAKQDNDIKMVQMNQNALDNITYVFGEDNYKYLVDKGLECRLVDKRPIVWDMDKEQFRHKLEVLHQGMLEFDEIVFLDWDCTECRPIADNFWDRLSEKAPLQAVLRQYHKRKAFWRKTDTRKIPEASFVYIRDKSITKSMNNLWEEMGRPWSEEVVIAKQIDNMMGEINTPWIEAYWKNYEPFFRTWGNAKVPSPNAKKEGCQYIHINNKVVAGVLKRAKGNSKALTTILENMAKR